LDDIYSIGTFAQVHEVQDMGNKLKLVIMAHRRIKIVNQIFEDITSKSEHGNKCFYFYLSYFLIIFSYFNQFHLIIDVRYFSYLILFCSSI